MRHLFIALALMLTACGGSDSEEETAPTAAPAGGEDTGSEDTGGEPPIEDPPLPMAPQRPEMTVEECEGQGATVVGDIGDGAIHREDYVCPSGAAPIGSVALGVEGSVCCP